ncbi:hypothetical protein NA57DRAFT_62064 [Rhizodiscina lignyota]|uniref:CENP-V/GFA domain-containing protein n=1 Tax=Rhizodiscina lignyota TaxID=1504668 RepID=A0A9P4I4T7_9PEZI|nr:hypothetical protein NA57DRAFT_62064 [Rhizodiscina lignyota]
MAAPIIIKGRCACGEVTFQSSGFPQHLDFCYCTTCQQVTGAPFGAWTGIKRDTIVWEGPTAKYRVSNIATRSLCVQCGGTLVIQYDCYPNKTHVAAGTITKGSELLPKVGMHIFVKSKPAWYSIPDDGLPRYEEFDEEFLGVLKRYSAQMGRNDPAYEAPSEGNSHESITNS